MYPRLTYDLPILSMDLVANNGTVSWWSFLGAASLWLCISCLAIYLPKDRVANSGTVSCLGTTQAALLRGRFLLAVCCLSSHPPVDGSGGQQRHGEGS